LLQDDRHLFFFETVGSGAYVAFGMLAEGGRIDAFDCLRQPLQPRLRVALLIPSMKVS